MNILPRFCTIFLCTLLLANCDGDDDSAQSSPRASSEPKSNPLSDEQQLIKDAQGLQSILDQNAEKKKKATDGAN